MMTFTGTHCDGRTLKGRTIGVSLLDSGELQIESSDANMRVPLAAVRISDRLGSVPRFIHLPDGGVIETMANDAVDAALARVQRGRVVALIHLLESHVRFAAFATVLLVAMVAACLQYGLPYLAARTARRVPPVIEAKAGEIALGALKTFLGPSQLKRHERRRVEEQLDRLLEARPGLPKPRLAFHQMHQFPNAFALPGNVLVVSDELVRLATHDDQIAAVLAHELGHLENRHGMQSVLRNSFALLVVASVTGDLSTLSAFAGTVPFILLQQGYAHDLEREADTYALNLMRKLDIETGHFTAILLKLESTRPGDRADYSYLSTHPDSEERTRRFGPAVEVAPAAIISRSADSADQVLSSGEVTLKRIMDPNFALPIPVRDERTRMNLPTITQEARPDLQVEPIYPSKLEAEGVSGEVVLDFIVAESGRPMSMTVVRSTNFEFSEAAATAAMQWKFSPALHDGRWANSRVAYQVTFTATEE